MNEWQPIETAPKDGRWLFVAWHDNDDCGYPTTTARYVGVGEWEEKRGKQSTEEISTPTHWQPLPPPPGAA